MLMNNSKVPYKYVQALIHAYPRPITQSELAQKSSVTKSAISKIRSTLLELCDMHTIAYKKKLVLKSDFDTFARIFHVYFLRLETEELFKSDYAKTVLNPGQIYDKLSQGLKEFSFTDYFNKKDINWAISLVLQNISAFQIQKDAISFVTAVLGSKIEDEDLSEVIPYIQLVSKLFTNFEITIENEEELQKTLALRDKIYLFIKDNVAAIASKLNVLKEMEDLEKKKLGIELLSKIAESIMKTTCNEITDYLRQQAKAKGIPFPKEYREIGALFGKSEGR